MNDCIAVNIQDMLKAIGEEELLTQLSHKVLGRNIP